MFQIGKDFNLSACVAAAAEKSASSFKQVIGLWSDFGQSLLYRAIQSPWDGSRQLINHLHGTDLLPEIELVSKPPESAFGTPAWHMELFGSAIGEALPYWIMQNLVRKSGALAGQALVEIGLAKLPAILTHPIVANGLAVAESVVSGFAFDGLLTPVDPTGNDFWTLRRNNAITGAVTFGLLASNSVRLRWIDKLLYGTRKPWLIDAFPTDLRRQIISGALAGMEGSELHAYLSGRKATGAELYQSAYTYAIVGGTLRVANHLIELHGNQTSISDLIASDPRLQSQVRFDPLVADQVAKLPRTQIKWSDYHPSQSIYDLLEMVKGHEHTGSRPLQLANTSTKPRYFLSVNGILAEHSMILGSNRQTRVWTDAYGNLNLRTKTAVGVLEGTAGERELLPGSRHRLTSKASIKIDEQTFDLETRRLSPYKLTINDGSFSTTYTLKPGETEELYEDNGPFKHKAAVIGLDDDGLYIQDAGSFKGIYVDRQRLPVNQKQHLAGTSFVSLEWLPPKARGILLFPTVLRTAAKTSLEKPGAIQSYEQSLSFFQNRAASDPLLDGFEAPVYAYESPSTAHGHFEHTNNFYVVVDRPNDPILQLAIRKAKQAMSALKITGDRNRAKFLALYTHQQLQPSNMDPHMLSQSIGSDMPESYSGHRVPLGEFLRIGRGVCVQQALLFKVLADEMGLRSTLIEGAYEAKAASTRPGLDHAWNSVILPLSSWENRDWPAVTHGEYLYDSRALGLLGEPYKITWDMEHYLPGRMIEWLRPQHPIVSWLSQKLAAFHSSHHQIACPPPESTMASLPLPAGVLRHWLTPVPKETVRLNPDGSRLHLDTTGEVQEKVLLSGERITQNRYPGGTISTAIRADGHRTTTTDTASPASSLTGWTDGTIVDRKPNLELTILPGKDTTVSAFPNGYSRTELPDKTLVMRFDTGTMVVLRPDGSSTTLKFNGVKQPDPPGSETYQFTDTGTSVTFLLDGTTITQYKNGCRLIQKAGEKPFWEDTTPAVLQALGI